MSSRYRSDLPGFASRTSRLTVLAAALAVTAAMAAVPEEKMPARGPATQPAAGRIDRSILEDPARPEKDKAEDAGRKALEIYEWLGVKQGMTVADLFASGGYNTHLLSRVVGESGKVYSVMEFYANKEAFDGRLYKVDEVKARIEKGSLTNVQILEKISEVPANSLDVAVIVRNYHDVEWVFESLKRKDVVAAIHQAMKPGGVVGIEEVATPKEGWDKEAHRLNEKLVIEDFTAGGFTLAGRSDMLASASDDHTKSGFEEGRQNMDRYLLKFRKAGN